MGILLVDILHVSARPHDANRIMAMNEPESMSRFMHHHLAEPFDEQRPVHFEAV